jgi:hypothetical protein
MEDACQLISVSVSVMSGSPTEARTTREMRKPVGEPCGPKHDGFVIMAGRFCFFRPMRNILLEFRRDLPRGKPRGNANPRRAFSPRFSRVAPHSNRSWPFHAGTIMHLTRALVKRKGQDDNHHYLCGASHFDRNVGQTTRCEFQPQVSLLFIRFRQVALVLAEPLRPSVRPIQCLGIEARW